MTGEPGQSRASQVQRLAHNGIALGAGGLVAQLAYTVFEILVARSLGATAFGVFATAKACAALGAYLMEFGTPMWTVQEGSRQPDRMPVLLGSSLALNFVFFAALYLVLVFATITVAANPVMSLLLIMLPYGLIIALQATLGAVFASYQTMHVTALFQALAPIAILALYFAYSTDTPTIEDAGLVFVVGSGIVTGIWLITTLRRVRPRFSLDNIRTALRSSYQYGVTGILGQIHYKTDIVMLSALAGLHEAGIYAAAFKLVELVKKVAMLSGRVFAPALFKASHESSETFRLFASMMTRFMAVAGLLVGLVSFVLADELILLLFGDTYASSVPVLRILGGVMAAQCMTQVLQLLMSSLDLHVRRNASLGVVVVVQIVANAILIPLFGAEGAAWATLFSGVLNVFLYAFLSSSGGNFRYLRWLLVPTALAVIIVTVIFLVDVNSFVAVGVTVLVFIASLFITGFVRRHEIDFVFRSVLNKGSQ